MDGASTTGQSSTSGVETSSDKGTSGSPQQ
jgi:hypothetical protein